MTRPTLATPSFTDRDIDELSWQFLKCDYAGPWYIDWSLDQRLTGFLRQQGLGRVADDGDLYAVLLDRVMSHIPQVARAGVG